MAKTGSQKQKLLALQQILLTKTDEGHPMTAEHLRDALIARGIPAERKSIYDDLHQLEEAGMDICKSAQGFFVQQRTFEDAELSMLMDAVAAARFITPKKTDGLMQKLTTLTSEHRGKALLRRTVVGARPKSQNESILYTAEDIALSISEGRQIRFYYLHWQYDPAKKPHFVAARGRQGAYYLVSPRAVVWDDENEYLIGYDHTHRQLRHYRLDRMEQVTCLNTPALPQPSGEPFDATAYCARHFGMFSGDQQQVKLRFHRDLAGAALDYFGAGAFVMPDDQAHFVLTAQVVVSPRFFSWVFGFGGKVQLLSPADAVHQMQEMLSQVYTQME